MAKQAASAEVPRRLTHRPRDERGYIVPWFVAWIDGKPDFRIVDAAKFKPAIEQKRCWVCGETLGAYLAFCIGSMCAINRTISEPPSHRDCAIYSARVCPFLTLPRAQRRRANLPEEHLKEPAGIGIARNPGAVCIWITKSYRIVRVDNGILFRLGDPIETVWFCEGREATRAEVLASIESGYPLLEETAREEGEAGLARLALMREEAMKLVPPEQSPVLRRLIEETKDKDGE